MLKKTLLLFFLATSCHLAFSQAHYIRTDGSVAMGVPFKRANAKDKARFVRVKTGRDEFKQLSPDEIVEYRLRNGRVYRSLTIQTTGERYFFQQLSFGKPSVYYLPSVFAGDEFYTVGSDSLSLIPLPRSRRALREVLREYVDGCDQAVKNTRHVMRTEASVGRLFDNYASCSRSYLPRPRIGLMFGVSFTKFSPKQAPVPVASASFSRMDEISVGLFAEHPIGRTNWSIATQPTIYNYDRWTYFSTGGRNHHLAFDEWRLSVPVVARYTFFNLRMSPFLEGGPSYSRNIDSKLTLYTYEQVGDEVFTDVERGEWIPKNQIGLTGGVGFVALQNSRVSWMFQFRFNKFYVMNHQHGSLKSNEIMISSGFLF